VEDSVAASAVATLAAVEAVGMSVASPLVALAQPRMRSEARVFILEEPWTDSAARGNLVPFALEPMPSGHTDSLLPVGDPLPSVTDRWRRAPTRARQLVANKAAPDQ